MSSLKKFISEGSGHSEKCPIDARRLYIRKGPKGRQKFVPWGAVCLICNMVVYPDGNTGEWTKYEKDNLSRQQKRRMDRNITKELKRRDKDKIKLDNLKKQLKEKLSDMTPEQAQRFIADQKKQFQDVFNKYELNA